MPSASAQTASGSPSFAATPSSLAPCSAETAPQAPGPSAASADATVSLQTRHLATAAALVLALVVGGGVLAFIALRRPSTVIVTAPPTDTQSNAATDSTAAPATNSPAANPEPAPGASTQPAPTSTDTQPPRAAASPTTAPAS